LDTIHDFNCRKCTLLSASRDLELMIEQGKRKMALKKEKEDGKQDEDHTSTSTSSEALENGDPEENVSPLENDITGNRDGVDMDKKLSKAKGTTITLEEMQSLKDKVDDCLANNIEMDLVSLPSDILVKIRQNAI